MIFTTKDLATLLAGFVLSIPASIIASLTLGPVLDLVARYPLIRALSCLSLNKNTDPLASGQWIQIWHVESTKFPPSNESRITFYRFRSLIAGDFTISMISGRSVSYRVVGRVEDNRNITGTWFDSRTGGYYGPFQTILSPTLDAAEGVWSGFSSLGIVKSGALIWQRKDSY